MYFERGREGERERERPPPYIADNPVLRREELPAIERLHN
jgi:hypothetical protein